MSRCALLIPIFIFVFDVYTYQISQFKHFKVAVSYFCIKSEQACRQLNLGGAGAGLVKSLGAFTCYMSSSIGEKVFAKIVLYDWHAAEK